MERHMFDELIRFLDQWNGVLLTELQEIRAELTRQRQPPRQFNPGIFLATSSPPVEMGDKIQKDIAEQRVLMSEEHKLNEILFKKWEGRIQVGQTWVTIGGLHIEVKITKVGATHVGFVPVHGEIERVQYLPDFVQTFKQKEEGAEGGQED